MDQVAGAVADPVRREILTRLRAGPMSAGEIADQFSVSRPAVSRHLRVLRESGLVSAELVGRSRLYRLDPAPLVELTTWLTGLLTSAQPTWSHRLDALATEVHRTRRAREARPPTETEQEIA